MSENSLENEKKKSTEKPGERSDMPLSSIAYSIASLFDSLEKMPLRYKENNGNGNGIAYKLGKDVTEVVVVAVTEIVKRYPTSSKAILSFIPEEARPYVSEIIDMYKDEPWDKTIEFVSRLLKAKGRNEATGEYRKTIDVAKELAGEMLQEELVEKLFGSWVE